MGKGATNERIGEKRIVFGISSEKSLLGDTCWHFRIVNRSE